MTTQSEVSPIDTAVEAAYAVHGYLDAMGRRDLPKIRARMLDALRERKVITPEDKKRGKPISQNSLVELIFPNTPGPDAWAGEEDPLLAEVVWKRLRTNLWTEADSKSKSKLQIMVASEMGNGYMLLRATVGTDLVPSVYITDNYALIREDLNGPNKRRAQLALERYLADSQMFATRQPNHAAAISRDFAKTTKQLASNAATALALTTESVSDADDDADADNAE